MKKIIKSADLLIQPFEFNITEQQGASSILGGFTTILIMIFTIFYFLGALIKNFNSLNDIYAGSLSEQNTNQIKQLENTLVAIEFSTDKGKVLSNITEISQYFNITGQFVQQQRIEEVQGYTRNYTSLNKVKCDKNRVEQFNFDPSAMTSQQQENLLCFDGYFHLQGQFYDSYFSYFRIMIQVCDNSTTQTCKSLEEINNLINQGIKIDLFVQGSRIRSKYNESSPAVQYSSNIYWKFNNQMADNEDIYIETIALDLKKSYFLNELFGIESYERIYNGQGIQKQERRQESTTVTNNAVLSSFYLRESTDFQYYFVIQQDYSALVFQAISQAAGLCLAILEIARVIYKGYNQHHIFETIMNSVYQFELKSKVNKRESIIDDSNLNKHLDDVKSYILKYNIHFFSISFIGTKSIVLYETKKIFKKLNLFPSKQAQTDKERELIISSLAKKKIESDLDLTNILKKLYEIDCLKLLLLDDNQLMLFNSICRPVFTNKAEELLEDNKKMIQEVEQCPLKELQKDSLQNLEQIEMNDNISQAALSKFPLDMRLAKLSWFFKSQLKLPNKLLIHNYRVIKKNGLVGLNKKLLQFTQQNNGLYTLLNKIAAKAQQEEEARIFKDLPNQQNKENLNNNEDHCIQMNNDNQSVKSDSNSNQGQHEISQGDKQRNE